MDWREFPQLVARTKIPSPQLFALAPVPEIPPLSPGEEHEIFDIDKAA
jgi:hypothetical protein